MRKLLADTPFMKGEVKRFLSSDRLGFVLESLLYMLV